MKLLAIETACAACSAAVWIDNAPVAARFAAMERGQAEALMPMVQAVVAESGVPFEALEFVAVTVGPGSFTGLRTGLAAARGIALARGLPILGVTTLEAVALAARRGAPERARAWPIVVALDSRRQTVFVQQFGPDLTPVGDPRTASTQAVAASLPAGGVVLAGDAAQRVLDAAGANVPPVALVSAARMPDAVCVAEIAAARWEAGGPARAGSAPVPMYLSPPEATHPAGGGRLRP